MLILRINIEKVIVAKNAEMWYNKSVVNYNIVCSMSEKNI